MSNVSARFGGDGDYLFGTWSAADMMFAPVVTRLRTYAMTLPPAADAYCDAVMAQPHMAEWIAAAQDETWVIARFEGERQD